MIEIEFIPLKTPEGNSGGHARVQGGFVELHARGVQRGQALVLTQSGYVTGAAEARIRADGRVRAIALHEDGKLLCFGCARGVTMTAAELRRRIGALHTVSVSVSEQPPAACQAAPARKAASAPAPAPVPAPASAPAPDAHAAECAKRPAAPPPVAPNEPVGDSGDALWPDDITAVPVSETVSETLARLSCEQDAAFFRQAEPVALDDQPQTPPGAQAAASRIEPMQGRAPASIDFEDAASLSALLARAEAVLSRILSPAFDMPEETGAPVIPATHAFDASKHMRFDAPKPETSQAPQSPPQTAPSTQAPQTAPSTQAPQTAPSPQTPQTAPSTQAPQTAPSTQAPPAGAKPCEADAPPPQEARKQAVKTYRSPVSQWHREADALLGLAAPAHGAPVENPFPHIFPGAVFSRTHDPVYGEALAGYWSRKGERFSITAVLGGYSPLPPSHLAGFTRYIRTLQGGFWVRVSD